MGFSYSPELYQRINVLSWVFSGLSILCSVFILASAWYLRSRPHTKHCVDRISFRLLCWAMGVEILYDVMYIGIYSGDPKGMPDKLCSAMVYIMIATMNSANWLCTCIAINLMLIIVYNVNPRHRRLERWYVVGSFVMGLGPPLVPAALNHFGKDTTPWGNCYMRDVEVHSRIVKLILDVYLWQGLSCLVAIVSTASVLFTLLRTSRRTIKALFAGNPLNASLSSATLGTLNERFIGIALRISSYPIALVIMNTILTTADLVYTEANTGVENLGQWVLLCLYILLYGGRGLVLGLLGVFIDPCLRKGYREARKSRLYPTVPPTSLALTLDYDSQNTSVRGVSSLPYTPPEPSTNDRPSSPFGTSVGSESTDESRQKDEDKDVDLESGTDVDRIGRQPRRRSQTGAASGARTGLGIWLTSRSQQDTSLEEAEELYNQVESQL